MQLRYNPKSGVGFNWGTSVSYVGSYVGNYPDPKRALSDAAQQMLPEAFVRLMQVVRPIVSAVGRTL